LVTTLLVSISCVDSNDILCYFIVHQYFKGQLNFGRFHVSGSTPLNLEG